jgi:hypothetical protein
MGASQGDELKYGNCLCGAIVLAFKHRFRGKFVVEPSVNGSCPHVLYEVDSYLYHYRIKRDFLPWPFYYFLFQGKFAKRKKGKPYVQR